MEPEPEVDKFTGPVETMVSSDSEKNHVCILAKNGSNPVRPKKYNKMVGPTNVSSLFSSSAGVEKIGGEPSLSSSVTTGCISKRGTKCYFLLNNF